MSNKNCELEFEIEKLQKDNEELKEIDEKNRLKGKQRRTDNMKYRFGNYEVECDEYDLENIADIFRDMYLGILGTTDEELKEALEREGYDVTESEE